jgi:hypothetical protein
MSSGPDIYYSLLFTASWITTATWGFDGRSEELHSKVWIACSLIAGTLFGLAALYHKAHDSENNYERFLLLTGPCALLTGWLACASLLGIGLYTTKSCIILLPEPTPSIVPLAASFGLAVLAIIVRTPVLMVGVLVLVLTQRSGPATVHTLALCIIVTGSVLSVLLPPLIQAGG